MYTKIVSLVLIIFCIIFLYFEMKKLYKTKETFSEKNIYFTREEPYSFSNLLATLNLFKEKTTKYSTLLQNLKVQEIAAEYDEASNEASNEATGETSN